MLRAPFPKVQSFSANVQSVIDLSVLNRKSGRDSSKYIAPTTFIERVIVWILLPLFPAVLNSLSVVLARQIPAGTISGSVTDSAGALVAGAEIIVTQRGTGAKRRLLTQVDGTYQAELKLIGEVFNLFNVANLTGYSDLLTQPNYGQPSARIPVGGAAHILEKWNQL